MHSFKNITGQIINLGNGFGTIKTNDAEYLFHVAELEDVSFQDLQKGDTVTFMVEEGSPLARKVRRQAA